jgi:peptidoglycan/LPS O-acetylase OafA/YrhL
MTYRAEIDGLRALAVIPVIFFHAGTTVFEGGFLGVDVFFVISGYLISSIVFNEIHAGSFDLIKFYERRARRILPALFLVLCITSLLYLLFIKPSEQETSLLEGSFLSTFLFCSNLYFPFHSGYFAAESELLPFIHTWSLSVEEQFYLLYPPLILLCLRMGKSAVSVFIVIVFALSLSSAQLGSVLFAKWNFYLLPTRAWELAIGAMCSIYLRRVQSRQNSIKGEIASLVGLSLIAYSLLSFDQETPYPSFQSLVPTLGTALVILFAQKQTLVQKLLSNKILVSIGLVSYSAYLWHQPLLSCARHLCVHPKIIPPIVIFFTICLTLVCAFLTFRFVEQPFRKSVYKLKTLAISMVVFLALYTGAKHFTKKFQTHRSQEFSSLSRDLARNDYDCVKRDATGYHFGFISETPPDVVLLGDSHARMLIPNLSEELKKNGLYGFHPYKNSSEKNALAINDDTSATEIKNWLTAVKELTERSKLTIVSVRYSSFFTGKWNYFYDLSHVDERILSQKNKTLFERLAQIHAISNKLVVIGPVPETPDWGPNAGRSLFGKTIPSSYAFFLQNNLPSLNLLRRFEDKHAETNVLYPHEYLLDSQSKLLRTSHKKAKGETLPLYYDDDHLNKLGSKELVRDIFE